jgi:hypothetical protein
MTEAEWQTCGDHAAMLAFLHTEGVNDYRKYRLLVVAYCHTFLPDLLTDERTRRAVEAAEAYADGVVAQGELARAKRAALKAVDGQPRLDLAVRGVTHGLPKRQAVEFPYYCLRPWRTSNYNHPTPPQGRLLGHLIRDIFGNPFRSVTVDRSWLAWNDGTVVKIAQSIYDDRVFDRLSILADALDEAGCDDDDILGHCRQQGAVHARGCWVVDLLTGRS